jgi:hypothetical protein
MVFTKALGTFLAAASVVAGECTREALIEARDNFFKGPSGGAKIASEAKIVFNQKVTPLASTPYSKLTGFTQLLVQAVDSFACDIATFRVSSSQLISVRLKIDEAGTISEVEILQAISGDQFFRPTGFPSTTPAIWSAKQKPGVPPTVPQSFNVKNQGHPGVPKADIKPGTCKTGAGAARLLTRTELIFVANSYADGLNGAPWDSCVFGGSSCPRNENGVVTTNNCAVGLGAFGFTTKGRRWVADTETGIVLGQFYFDYSKYGALAQAAPFNLYLHEYIKVDAAKLAYIFAPMKNIATKDATAQLFT